jgi:hypothetical protein
LAPSGECPWRVPLFQAVSSDRVNQLPVKSS